MIEKEILEKIESYLRERKEKEVFEEIEAFHKDRLNKLKRNETSKPFPEGGKIVFHLIPFESFSISKHYDFSGYKGQILGLKPMRFNSLDQEYNFDGILHFELGSEKKCLAYIQAYVDGKIEAVDSYYLGVERKELFIFDIENGIVSSIKEYLKFQKDIGVKLPIVSYLAFLGAKDFLIEYGRIDNYFDNIHPIDREDLILPRIIIENFDASIEDLLKINFDLLWNACGYPRSFHYDENRKWIKK